MIDMIKDYLYKIYEDECSCNEGSITEDDLAYIFELLDKLKED